MRLPADSRIEDIEIGSHQRCHIMCAILTFGMIPIEAFVAFSRMQMPINGQVFQHIIKGMEVGEARNRAVEFVMKMPKEERPRWLFFWGDDMLPPWDGFVRLFEEAERNKWDCLTGLYYWKGEPPTPLTWRDDTIGRLIPGVHFKSGDVIHVDLTGLDFTLIRVSLLEQMTAPYFKTGPSKRKDVPKEIKEYSNPDSIITHTEDTWFYGKAKKLGAKIGVHAGVRVAHLDVKTGMIYWGGRMARKKRRSRRRNPLSSNMSAHLDSLLEKMNRVSIQAGKLATWVNANEYGWLKSQLNEIAEKVDNMGTELELALEEKE